MNTDEKAPGGGDPPLGREEIKRELREAIEQFQRSREAAEAEEKEAERQKGRLTSRVSIAAISLTMLMSFLNFARTERDGAATGARTQAANARSAAEANWAHYQTTTAERASYRVADDALVQMADALPDEDPRVGAAHVRHIEYQSRIRGIDRENQQVFFVVQDLERRAALATRAADTIDRGVARYDLGSRVLTLALVLLSVTLLANRNYLFWVGVGVASVGGAIAVNGYFLLF
ncbi:MAG: DUF4337 family protein [Deltaproteobacteria bacterium]